MVKKYAIYSDLGTSDECWRFCDSKEELDRVLPEWEEAGQVVGWVYQEINTKGQSWKRVIGDDS